MIAMKRMQKNFLGFAVVTLAVFFLFSMYFNHFGSNAAPMMSFFGITESQQGLILTVQAIGGTATTVFLALYGERFNKLKVIGLGLLLLTGAMLLIAAMPLYLSQGTGYAVILLWVVFAGIGCNCLDVMINGAIPELYPEQKETMLSLAQASYGTGAMLSPFFVTAIVNPDIASSFAVPLLIIGGASLLMVAPFWVCARKILPQTPYADMNQIRQRAVENPAEIFKTGKAWLFAIAAITYFFFQIGVSAWMPTYFQRSLELDFQLSGLLLTLLFAGALVMRFLAPLVFRKMPVQRYFIGAGLLSAVCFVLCFTLRSVPVILALVVVGGFLQGAMVSALMILCCNAFPERTASAIALVTVGVSLASFVAPFVMGRIAEATGSFQLPMLLISACLAVSAGFLKLATREKKAADT